MADDLASQIAAAMREVDKQVGDLIRSITLTAYRELVEISPVDTGWSRANWIPGIGTAPSSPVGARDAFSLGAQASGVAEVMGYRSPNQGPLYLSNSVPYIVYLNAGSSSQAPAGYVEDAVYRAVELAQSFGMEALDSAISFATSLGAF